MSCQQLCPYYRRRMERCDMGYGYISPHCVETIVRHCISRFEDCGNYQLLTQQTAKHPIDTGERHAFEDNTVALTATSELPCLVVDDKTISLLQHHIRTPLTNIRSFAEILQRYDIDDPSTQRRFLRIILEETQRLTQTLEQLFNSETNEKRFSDT